MRIVYASNIDIGSGSGPGVNEREFLVQLSRSGVANVTIIAPEPSGNVADELEGATFVALPRVRRLRILNWLIQQICLTWLLMRRGAVVDFAVLRLAAFPFAAACFAITQRVPYFVKTAGDGLFLGLFKDRPIVRLAKSINHRLFSLILHRASGIDVVSEVHRQSLAIETSIAKERILVVDNAVNVSRFTPIHRSQVRTVRAELGLERFDPIIGYTGNYPLDRGGAELIRILPTLLESYPDAGVLILGSDSGADQLRQAAAENGLSERVLMPGYVPFEKVPSYVNCLDVGVSILPVERRGSSEQKVRQYLACGVPAVTTPGSNDFIEAGDVGSVVSGDDLDEITRAIIRWIERTRAEGDQLRLRIAAYARANLSVESAVNRRLVWWKTRLPSRETRAPRVTPA